jgi:hypothetical protein
LAEGDEEEKQKKGKAFHGGLSVTIG